MPEPDELARFVRQAGRGSRRQTLALLALDFRGAIAGLVEGAAGQGLEIPPELVAEAQQLAAWVEAAGREMSG